MELEMNNWEFNKQVAKEFDEHVRKSVPQYNEIHQMVTDIAGWFIEDDTNVYDIGTGTGTVLKNLTRRYNRKAGYIGIDSSPDMISQFSIEDDFLVVNKDALDYKYFGASLITCVLTLQFIPIQHRSVLLERFYNGTNDGGALILVEKVLSEDSEIQNILNSLHTDDKYYNGLSPEDIFNKERSIRGIVKPLTTKENIDLLRKAGYNKVEPFFKWGNFVGILAIK